MSKVDCTTFPLSCLILCGVERLYLFFAFFIMLSWIPKASIHLTRVYVLLRQMGYNQTHVFGLGRQHEYREETYSMLTWGERTFVVMDMLMAVPLCHSFTTNYTHLSVLLYFKAY